MDNILSKLTEFGKKVFTLNQINDFQIALLKSENQQLLNKQLNSGESNSES